MSSLELPRSATGKSACDVALMAVEEAGKVLLKAFRGEKKVRFKGRGNVVTDLDHRVEKQTIELLMREFPTFGILAEEGGRSQGDGQYTWVLDPLDGTRNYASGNPTYSVNIGLIKDEETVLGLTYDPVRNELFHAVKGGGAFLNGRPIRVSRQKTVKDSVVGLDMGYSDERGKQALEMLVQLWPGMQTIRIMGSAALGLAYAASGRIDIYIHHTLAPWDLVSGLVLVREAGGIITDGNGGPAHLRCKSIIASNKAIHADFLKLTEGCTWRQSVRESPVRS